MVKGEMMKRSGIALEYDFFFNDRNTINPSIGPVRGNS